MVVPPDYAMMPDLRVIVLSHECDVRSLGNRLSNEKGAPNQDCSQSRREAAVSNSLADAPFRERGPSAASILQEPEGPGSRFSGKQ